MLYKIGSDGTLDGKAGYWGTKTKESETAKRTSGSDLTGEYDIEGKNPEGEDYTIEALRFKRRRRLHIRLDGRERRSKVSALGKPTRFRSESAAKNAASSPTKSKPTARSTANGADNLRPRSGRKRQ